MVYFFAWFVVCLLILAADSSCPDGRDISKYSGTTSVTDGGRQCQKWAAQIPHAHEFNNISVFYFKVDESLEEAVNYCRNPDGDPFPWCYTTDSYTRWQYCNGEICNIDNAVCGGVQTSDSGYIAFTVTVTPSFSALDCLWTLKASPNHLIELTALQTDFFDKESCNNYLQVYETGYHFGRFCGTVTKVPPITSKTGVLYVRFYSVYTGSSFSVNYSQVIVPPDTSVMDPHCGGLLILNHGLIYSPDRDGDGYYEPVEDCNWQLAAPQNHYIVLRANFMDIENIPKCDNDFLEVYETNKYYGKFCGEALPYIVSVSNLLYVRFLSDFEVTGRGFNLTYHYQPTKEKSTTASEDGSRTVGNINGTELDSTSSPKTMQSTVVFSAGVDVCNICKMHSTVIAAADMFLMTMVFKH